MKRHDSRPETRTATISRSAAHGSLEFNLEELNHLNFTDSREDVAVQRRHKTLVTGLGHPYVDHFLPPGHTVGYQRTFTATLVDFLNSVTKVECFHAEFADALQVQRVLQAVVRSGEQRKWVQPGRSKGIESLQNSAALSHCRSRLKYVASATRFAGMTQ